MKLAGLARQGNASLRRVFGPTAKHSVPTFSGDMKARTAWAPICFYLFIRQAYGTFHSMYIYKSTNSLPQLT